MFEDKTSFPCKLWVTVPKQLQVAADFSWPPVGGFFWRLGLYDWDHDQNEWTTTSSALAILPPQKFHTGIKMLNHKCLGCTKGICLYSDCQSYFIMFSISPSVEEQQTYCQDKTDLKQKYVFVTDCFLRKLHWCYCGHIERQQNLPDLLKCIHCITKCLSHYRALWTFACFFQKRNPC